MPLTDPALWSERLQQTLVCYEEPLLREVAGKLVKPRSHWPAEELIKRSLETVTNPAVIDRRLGDLEPAGRRLLALLAHSRQPSWHVGNLVELLTALGHADGLAPVLSLLEAGLLYPDLLPAQGTLRPRYKSFATWLGQTAAPLLTVCAHPAVTARALGEDLGLPDLSREQSDENKDERGLSSPAAGRLPPADFQEADGLEWLLRLAVLWQQVKSAPLRRTLQRDFFKRDLDRLRSDSLLSAPLQDGLAELPDPGLLAVALAVAEGLLEERDGELYAGALPGAWEEDLPVALVSLWAALPRLECWGPATGWDPAVPAGNPYASACLLALLLLARLPEGASVQPADVAGWVVQHHPYWSGGESASLAVRALVRFLLSVAYPLRLLQAARDKQEWFVRLSPLGRWVLGLGQQPAVPVYAQTLLVQPNLEILAYRQGLTPTLIGRLGRFAAWKSLGAACTLQLQPETVYAALESGETFETILQALQRHGMKETPTPVVESLRTWANKRERISIFPAATLFEFATPEELSEALARGLPAVRLSDRLAAVASEKDVDFRHFRLTATRDYTLPPERCVTVETDGVTLSVDLARADLLLESELQRFAEPVEQSVNGRRRYRLTPASTTVAREHGLTLAGLEHWFLQRSGGPLSPAARLLLTGSGEPALRLRRLLVLHVHSAEIADGLQQWPGTRALIAERIGPTSLAVSQEHLSALQERLQQLGMTAEPNE